jgi:hypothetical protein
MGYLDLTPLTGHIPPSPPPPLLVQHDPRIGVGKHDQAYNPLCIPQRQLVDHHWTRLLVPTHTQILIAQHAVIEVQIRMRWLASIVLLTPGPTTPTIPTPASLSLSLLTPFVTLPGLFNPNSCSNTFHGSCGWLMFHHDVSFVMPDLFTCLSRAVQL